MIQNVEKNYTRSEPNRIQRDKPYRKTNYVDCNCKDTSKLKSHEIQTKTKCKTYLKDVTYAKNINNTF